MPSKADLIFRMVIGHFNTITLLLTYEPIIIKPETVHRRWVMLRYTQLVTKSYFYYMTNLYFSSNFTKISC